MRSETYEYYRLPFCPPTGGLEHKSEDLGEVRMLRILQPHSSPNTPPRFICPLKFRLVVVGPRSLDRLEWCRWLHPRAPLSFCDVICSVTWFLQ
jgi:hypothetical protein